MEGTFASLDRLGWDKSRVRGQWKVHREGYMSALDHNVPKMVGRLGRGVGPPGPASPAAGTVADAEYAMTDAAAYRSALPRYLFWVSWLVSGLTPVLR